MTRLIAVALLGAAVASFAMAAVGPEIDANTGVSALTLLSGAALVMRARCRK